MPTSGTKVSPTEEENCSQDLVTDLHIKVWEPELEKRGCASVEYSKCDFCGKENAKKLVHNISYWEELEPFRPRH